MRAGYFVRSGSDITSIDSPGALGMLIWFFWCSHSVIGYVRGSKIDMVEGGGPPAWIWRLAIPEAARARANYGLLILS